MKAREAIQPPPLCSKGGRTQWKENWSFCIGRQFGSGGHEIGQSLAQKLSIPFYDKEILKLAAQESGIMPELFEKADEKPSNSLLYSMSSAAHGRAAPFASYNDYLTNDKLFLFQSNTIKRLAQEGSCVIIGRCADYILRGRKDMLSVYVHAPLELRIQRICRLRNIEEDAARSLIKKDGQKPRQLLQLLCRERLGRRRNVRFVRQLRQAGHTARRRDAGRRRRAPRRALRAPSQRRGAIKKTKVLRLCFLVEPRVKTASFFLYITPLWERPRARMPGAFSCFYTYIYFSGKARFARARRPSASALCRPCPAHSAPPFPRPPAARRPGIVPPCA